MMNFFLLAVVGLTMVQAKGISGSDITIFNSFNYKVFGENECLAFNGEFDIEEQKEDITSFNTTIDSAKKSIFLSKKTIGNFR